MFLLGSLEKYFATELYKSQSTLALYSQQNSYIFSGTICLRFIMVNYKVDLFTGHMKCADTKNSIYIKLSGTNRESEMTYINKTAYRGSVIEYQVLCPSTLGQLEAITERTQELENRRQAYQWSTYIVGLPNIINIKHPSELPAEVRYSFTKTIEFEFTAAFAIC
ncbi:hypothetical protein DPEC_G00192400 [Dallia pectoralis]|uniref:Uncharacterized protein n=1 Tax=Dallia pectoralis TaxID=75939 RepID=A0ACC2GCM7_DALPE|nr:hypothetical protein DPEC_G00192400 [Dallia pectoralis]